MVSWIRWLFESPEGIRWREFCEGTFFDVHQNIDLEQIAVLKASVTAASEYSVLCCSRAIFKSCGNLRQQIWGEMTAHDYQQWQYLFLAQVAKIKDTATRTAGRRCADSIVGMTSNVGR